MKDLNLNYIKRGHTGCVFATIMARNPDKVGWVRIFNPDKLVIPNDAYIVSYIFEGKTQEEVRKWAIDNGMYEEPTSDNTTGLRYDGEESPSWVQYFGPDSHVKTRQAPVAELLFCVSISRNYYKKVGIKGVLHLAHASVEHIKEKSLDRIWNSCFTQTKKILGHEPTIAEAAKTTFKN